MSFTLQSNVSQVIAQQRRKLEKVVSDTTFNIQGRMREGFAEEKHGHDYGRHVASAPGESPAMDTAAYANALQAEASGFNGVVGTNQEQAEVLEFGGVHMEARPHFEPAFEAERPVFEKALEDALK